MPNGGSPAAQSLFWRIVGARPPLDDRGAPILCLDLRQMRRGAIGADKPALAATLKEIIKTSARGYHPAQLLVSAACLVGFVASYIALRAVGAARTFLGWAILWSIAETLIGRWLTRRIIARDAARTVAAHGLCGGCAYTLEGVPAQADGCLICPECGGAWAAERLTRAHWLPPKVPLFAPRTWWMWITLTTAGVGSDVRGVIHRRLDARLRGVRAAIRAKRGPLHWRALRQDLTRIGRWWRAAFAAPVVALAVVCLRALILEAISPPPRDLALMIFLAIATPLVGASAGAIFFGEWGMNRRRVVGAFLRHRACPVCADTLEPPSTGWGEQLCCDNCGCAWAPQTPPPARPIGAPSASSG